MCMRVHEGRTSKEGGHRRVLCFAKELHWQCERGKDMTETGETSEQDIMVTQLGDNEIL